MTAKDLGRFGTRMTLALASAGAVAWGAGHALAQQSKAAKPAQAQPKAPAPAQPKPTDLDGEFKAEIKHVPVNPTDPIAIVNGERITRQELADECVARSGEKILADLINRKLIEQAVRASRVKVTMEEINAEIERQAQAMAKMGREQWLETLAKERGISPSQYARDIVYPNLALKKLATPTVQVTKKDIKDAFEANYGERLHCRMIMVNSSQMAKMICEELRRAPTPAKFEQIARERSIDPATRALGGLLPEPITRHANPRAVADTAFAQLVDGDDKSDKAHKPKDGSFTGPIEVNENSWVILMREKVVPGNTEARLDDPRIQQSLRETIVDAKVQEKMQTIFNDMYTKAAIDNRLTGQRSTAMELQEPARGEVDARVTPSASSPQPKAAARPAAAPTRR
ncbi:MAG TPA: parvulin peptidyl-prolyl isomerase [Isosphaeraceae bacterium]|jgi:foldase protein PrsA|nr:parvulin peptidyl-prolyl isomerase [Isosphaeraceae bacterium]